MKRTRPPKADLKVLKMYLSSRGVACIHTTMRQQRTSETCREVQVGQGGTIKHLTTAYYHGTPTKHSPVLRLTASEFQEHWPQEQVTHDAGLG